MPWPNRGRRRIENGSSKPVHFGETGGTFSLGPDQAMPHLQTNWYIQTFVVPALLVTHAMIFVRLLTRQNPTDQVS